MVVHLRLAYTRLYSVMAHLMCGDSSGHTESRKRVAFDDSDDDSEHFDADADVVMDEPSGPGPSTKRMTGGGNPTPLPGDARPVVLVEPASAVDPASDKWVSEDELCAMLSQKSKMSGHLLRDAGRADFPQEIAVLHVAQDFAVLYDTTDNHLYVAPYLSEDQRASSDTGATRPDEVVDGFAEPSADGMIDASAEPSADGVADGFTEPLANSTIDGFTEPPRSGDYTCDYSRITRLECSQGYDLDDLPMFSTCDGFEPRGGESWMVDKPTHLLAVCDNIGQIRVWDAETGALVLALQCTKQPNNPKSHLTSPNAFCMSPSHLVVATAPSSKHTMIYYRGLDWTKIRDASTVSAVDFVLGNHRSDPVTRHLTSSDDTEMHMCMSKLVGVTSIASNVPSMPGLFWMTTKSGLASFNAQLPPFAATLLPSLDWPAYISSKYVSPTCRM
jgi:hypothetical protein